jgi:hypothetical protein
MKIQKQTLNTIKTILVFILIVSPFLIFESFLINGFFETYPGRLISSFNTRTLLSDIIFCVYLGAIFLYYIEKRRKRYKFSTIYYLIIGSVLTYYISFRYFSSWRPELQLEFTNSGIFGIPYLDLIFYSLIVGNLISLIYFSKGKTHDEGNLSNDQPIYKSEDDELSYKDLSKLIAEKILEIKLSEKAFNIGITGKWGIGKTSLLNLIKHELNNQKKTNVSDHILLSYSPLLLDSRKSLTEDFLLKLNSKLRKYSIESTINTKNYIQSLKDSYNNIWWNLLSPLLSNSGYEENALSFSRTIEKINRRIIIIIDDLDRLNKDEVNEILRLIRNILDFKNIIFVLAYDKISLIERLKENEITHPELFIEKFFTLEVEVPIFKSYRIRELFLEEIKLRMPGSKERIDKVFEYTPQIIVNSIKINSDQTYFDIDFFENTIETKRDIKRFINNLIMIPENIFSEYETEQLLTLELIRLKHYQLYNNIKSKKYFKDTTSQYYGIDTEKLQNDKESIKSDKLLNVTTTLFEPKNKRTISNQHRFDLYFSYNIDGFVKYTHIEELRENNEKCIEVKKYVNSVFNESDNNKRQIISYLTDVISFYSYEDFKTIIEIMIELDLFSDFNIRKVIQHMNNYYKSNPQTQSTIKKYLLDLFENQIKLGEKATIYGALLDKSIHSEEIQFPISYEEVKQICVKRLKNFVALNEDDFDSCFELYYKCLDKVDDQKNIILNKEANSFMNDYACLFPNSYIKSLLIPYGTPIHASRDSEFAIRPFVDQTFGSWDNFAQFIEDWYTKLESPRKSTDEFTKYYNFIKEYLKRGKKPVVVAYSDWPKYGIDTLIKEKNWKVVEK